MQTVIGGRCSQVLPRWSLSTNALRRTIVRRLHLAPPFLLDDPYIPRYNQLSSAEAVSKQRKAAEHLRNCNLCPRKCSVNRSQTTGFCLVPAATVKVSTIAPHFGEEACLQGTRGSGSVFFSGCSLRCVFCQNFDISHQRTGFDLTPTDLAAWFVKLQDVGGAHNINLVTPEHVVPQIVLAILEAREQGLKVPIVYNTSAYDSLASLELLNGLVDIYLPDFKVWEDDTARRLLKADGYADAARESLREMYRQVGDLCFTPDGLAKRGVLVRHLVMPGLADEGKSIVQWLASEEGVGKDVYVHIMEQYSPRAHVGKPKRGSRMKEGEAQKVEATGSVRYADINRPVHSDELLLVKQAAESAGIWRFEEAPKHGGWVS